MPSIPLTHPNSSNSPNTQIDSHNPWKKRKEFLRIETELQTLTINPLASNKDGGRVWKYRGTSAKKLAQETTSNHAINAVYCDFDITLIDVWRICPAKRKDMSNDSSPQQEHYHIHNGPMVIEKWALPFFKKAGFQPASISTAARIDIECARCQICNYPRGLEPKNSEPPCPGISISKL
eukprot:513839-Pelagomonas_calceolata.AAC.1